MKGLKNILQPLALIIVLFIGYLVLKPNEVWPVAYDAPENPGFTGIYAANEKLASAKKYSVSPEEGPEDVAIDKDGNIYVGTKDGKILKFTPDKSAYSVFANTRGRPLGLDFTADGKLIVADAERGLLMVDTSGRIEFLSQASDSIQFKFTDDIEVGSDGKYYFSDASTLFGVHEYKFDLLAHHPTGRLLVYDTASKSTSTLLDSLYFANGIAVSDSADFVLIAQTSDYSIVKFYIKGTKAGQKETILKNLPGFPDGISRGSKGIFWIAIASPRDKMLDMLSQRARTRKYMANLPSFLLPKPKAYGMVLGIDGNGKVVYNLQDTKGNFYPITSVQEHNGLLYLGSLSAPDFAIFDLKNL